VKQHDREEAELVRQLDAGEIDGTEYNARMADLQRDYIDAAVEAAEDAARAAYEAELERW